MIIKRGVYLQLEIKNLVDILELKKEDDLYRSINLHRLNTYFSGLSYLLQKYDAVIENNIGGAAHISFRDFGQNDFLEKTMEGIAACFAYTNDIFNELEAYKLFEPFLIRCGADYGKFYSHDFFSKGAEKQRISLGTIVENAEKAHYHAKANHLTIMEGLFCALNKETQGVFCKLDEDEKDKIRNWIDYERLFTTHYKNILKPENLIELTNSMDNVLNKVNREANSLNTHEKTISSKHLYFYFNCLDLTAKNSCYKDRNMVCIEIKGIEKLLEIDEAHIKPLNYILDTVYDYFLNNYLFRGGGFFQFHSNKIFIAFGDGLKFMRVAHVFSMIQELERAKKINKYPVVRYLLDTDQLQFVFSSTIGEIICSKFNYDNCNDALFISTAFKELNDLHYNYSKTSYLVLGERPASYVLRPQLSVAAWLIMSQMTLITGTEAYYVNTNLSNLNLNQKEV